MIAIPTHNVEERAANPHYAGLLALLAEHGLKTDDGWLVAYEMHNPVMRYLIAGEFAPPDPIPPKPLTSALTAIATQRAVQASAGIKSPSPAPATPVAADQWPAWAKLVQLRAKDGDKGIGDTIHREAGIVGQTWENLYMTLTGHPCGCGTRAEVLNQRYPY